MDRGAWQATVHGVTKSWHDWATNTFTIIKEDDILFSSHQDHCTMGSNSLQWERGHWLGKGSGALGITRSAQEHFEEILQEISEMLEGSKSGLFAIEGWVCISRWVPCLMKDQFQLKGPDLLIHPFPPQPVLYRLSTILSVLAQP